MGRGMARWVVGATSHAGAVQQEAMTVASAAQSPNEILGTAARSRLLGTPARQTHQGGSIRR